MRLDIQLVRCDKAYVIRPAVEDEVRSVFIVPHSSAFSSRKVPANKITGIGTCTSMPSTKTNEALTFQDVCRIQYARRLVDLQGEAYSEQYGIVHAWKGIRAKE